MHPKIEMARRFWELFEGRTDAYGTAEGGCERVRPAADSVTARVIEHLSGAAPLGIYPVVSPEPGLLSAVVKWGCVDFDRKSEGHRSFDYETEEECHTAAVNLQKVLAALHVTAWIERTRSCGRHVWIFSSSWVPAQTMRRSLLISCGVAGVSQREVNPKQETLAEGQLGNYVRLPYPGGLTAPLLDTQVVLFDQKTTHRMGVQWFVKEALAARTSPQILEAIAAKWKAPEPTLSTIDWGTKVTSLDVTLVSRLTATGRSVFTNGPNDGDRSRGMVYLAKQAKVSGLTPHEALTLLRGAHWNKYKNRADEELQLRNIVSRAWT